MVGAVRHAMYRIFDHYLLMEFFPVYLSLQHISNTLCDSPRTGASITRYIQRSTLLFRCVKLIRLGLDFRSKASWGRDRVAYRAEKFAYCKSNKPIAFLAAV